MEVRRTDEADAMKPAAIQTDGIGSRTTAHLNLTVTLADVWKADPWRKIYIKPTK